MAVFFLALAIAAMLLLLMYFLNYTHGERLRLQKRNKALQEENDDDKKQYTQNMEIVRRKRKET